MIKKLLPKQAANARDRLKSALVASAGTLMRAHKSPDEAFGELFLEVQARKIYQDGKTFVDLIPRKRARELLKEYEVIKHDPNFDLREFVNRHFYEFTPQSHDQAPVPRAKTARQHVRNLWGTLERRNRINRGSLIALPHMYIVPGGRFAEQFYWDSYFVMLGLAADKHWDIVAGMMKNYAYMIRKWGYIPTANRTYLLSRSQPPFLSHMVKLLASERGRLRTMTEYLPALVGEYTFWMKGRTRIASDPDHRAYARLVQMPSGAILNRYYDNKTTPRPESQREDIEVAEIADSDNRDKLFLDLRAAAESGWDFSSRWFRDPHEIQSIHTTDIVPIDLNCLLYHLEMTLAEAYDLLKQPLLRRKFIKRAEVRAEAIRRYMWDPRGKFFHDYDFRLGKRTPALTLAAVFPLYVRIATPEQAQAVAERLERDFLQDAGLVTTLVHNGQQWDWPNGWAPLQWVAIEGLRNYGHHELADRIKIRWLRACEKVYDRHGKMIEKYNVLRAGDLGGGGEYQLQDGFGWTNGVYAALKDEERG